MLARVTALSFTLLALTAPVARASSQDVASTHAYIQANFALVRAEVSLIHTGEARIQALRRQLASECPLAGQGSPVDEATQPMSYEVAAALWAVSYGTAAGPIGAFVKAVKPLRWSNARITGIARGYAASLHELSTFAAPSLCTDVRAWKASGFATVPANVAALDKRLEATQGETVPPRLLAPFERGGDAAVVARTRTLERKLAENEFMVGQTDWIEVLETLGLPE